MFVKCETSGVGRIFTFLQAEVREFQFISFRLCFKECIA